MAKIHILPAQPHGVDQFERLRADLAAAHARGADLGSRAPHIQAGGERLLQLCSELEEAIDDWDWWLTEHGLQDQASDKALRQLLSTVQGLVRTTRRFPSGP